MFKMLAAIGLVSLLSIGTAMAAPIDTITITGTWNSGTKDSAGLFGAVGPVCGLARVLGGVFGDHEISLYALRSVVSAWTRKLCSGIGCRNRRESFSRRLNFFAGRADEAPTAHPED